MHVRRVVEDGADVQESWLGDSSWDVVFVEIVVLCLCDGADVRERADVSAGSSWISGILHVRAKNIACVRREIREYFLGRSQRAASFTTNNFF